MQTHQRGRVTRWVAGADAPSHRADALAAEAPLEIRVNGHAFSVTMRTPGDDPALVLGFLLSEGVIQRRDQVVRIVDLPAVTPDGRREHNVLDVVLTPGTAPPDTSMQRHVYTTSSCGICGTASIDAVRRSSRYDPSTDPLSVPLARVLELPDRLRERQSLFGRTGGVHAAGLFRAQDPQAQDAPDLLITHEDVGRHNAVDKVLGWALQQELLPLAGSVLQLSGRASFELVQKAAMAGVPIVSAVSAPSSLAVDLAHELGITLIGFNRGDRCNVYARDDRLVAS